MFNHVPNEEEARQLAVEMKDNKRKLMGKFVSYSPVIIFEGIDNAGKTTLIQKLRQFTGATSIHPTAVDEPLHEHERSIFDEYRRVWQMCNLPNNRGILLDRFLGSEYAYSWYDEECTTRIDTHTGLQFLGDDKPKDFKAYQELLSGVLRTSSCVVVIYVHCDFEDYCSRQGSECYSDEQFELYTSRYKDFLRFWCRDMNSLNYAKEPVIEIDTSMMDELHSFVYLVRRLNLII